MILEAQLIDLHLRQIYPVALEVEEQKIKKITKINPKPRLPYLLPGFIDAHVHVESSMLVPSEFARLRSFTAPLPPSPILMKSQMSVGCRA